MNSLYDIETEVLQENFKGKGKLKKGLKNLGNKIKDKVNNIKETISEPEFIPLTPFKPVMQGILKKKGLNSEGSLPDVARRFFSEVVQKKKNYEEFVDPVTAGVIVQAVIKFIKSITDKAEKGEELSNEEKSIADDVLTFAQTALDAPDAVFSEKNITKELGSGSKSKIKEDTGKSASITAGLELSPVTILAIGAVLYFALRK